MSEEKNTTIERSIPSPEVLNAMFPNGAGTEEFSELLEKYNGTKIVEKIKSIVDSSPKEKAGSALLMNLQLEELKIIPEEIFSGIKNAFTIEMMESLNKVTVAKQRNADSGEMIPLFEYYLKRFPFNEKTKTIFDKGLYETYKNISDTFASEYLKLKMLQLESIENASQFLALIFEKNDISSSAVGNFFVQLPDKFNKFSFDNALVNVIDKIISIPAERVNFFESLKTGRADEKNIDIFNQLVDIFDDEKLKIILPIDTYKQWEAVKNVRKYFSNKNDSEETQSDKLLNKIKKHPKGFVARTIFFWILIIAAFIYANDSVGIWGGILAAVAMYFFQAFIIWLLDLDDVRKYRFFWKKEK
ncbi:MAG: hypothetical protein ABSE76_00700 [Minisyncoccia bacterium]|jgi:hypothetical protein